MKKIRVKLKQKGYDVIIGRGLLRSAGGLVKKLVAAKSARVFVVTSANVRSHWGEKLEKSLRDARLAFEFLEMNDGEPAKRLQTVEQLADQMIAARADRQSLVVAFGGGVVGDCAGFLASIFMRGIPVVQIPTTFLAQVDASIGGKTGVNLSRGKNLIGAFHQPQAVLVDTEVLSTLSEREFRSGLFEALKCGVIQDRALFEFMRRQSQKILTRDRAALERIIAESVRVKANVVSADERESDLRRVLNFGHTVGHALEAATEYNQLLHGEAVAWGMIAAARIAAESSYCQPAVAAEIEEAVHAYGPLPRLRVGVEQIVPLLASDKKTVGGSVHFVLPVKIGKVTVSSGVKPEVVRRAVEHITNHG